MVDNSLRHWVGCGSCCILLALLGCGEDSIREVRVPRDRSGLEAPQFQAPGAAAATPSAATGMGAMATTVSSGDRLLIAMIDRPQATYFLRLQASAAAVDQARPDFDQIVRSLTFNNGGLQWKLPTGWTESEGGAMFRIATLKSPGGVEVFVTQLTPGQEVLPNVNRWQGQLGLPPVTADTMPIQRLDVGGQAVIIYDATKPQVESASDRAPSSANGAAVQRTTGESPPRPPVDQNPERISPFLFPELDSEWSSLPASIVATARWEKPTPSGELKLEVFKFPAEATFSSMLGIWAERVALPAPSEEVLTAALEVLPVADLNGQRVLWPTADMIAAQELGAGDSISDARAILVTRVESGSEAWYFKLEGPREDVIAASSFFDDFLRQTTR